MIGGSDGELTGPEATTLRLTVPAVVPPQFLNYWVDEKAGTVFCLAEAPDSNALVMTHKEAHGLIPKDVKEVQEGK